MRNKPCPIILLPALFLALLLPLPAAAQESGAVRFSFRPEKKFKIITRSDTRFWTDGSYQGLLAREVRGLYERADYPESAGGVQVQGTYYVLEDLYRSALGTARMLDQRYEAGFIIHPDGRYQFEDSGTYTAGTSQGTGRAGPAGGNSGLYPRMRSFPRFPSDPVAPGESWTATSTRILESPENGRLTRIPILCEYTYAGTGTYQGQTVRTIQAQYAVRYRRGEDRRGDPDLSRVSGSHRLAIYVGENGPLFMRDQMEEQMSFTNGGSYREKGFILTFFKGIRGMDRPRVVEDVKRDIENGLQNGKLTREERDSLEVTEKKEGVAVNMSDLHFVPDKAQLLPEEKAKLDTMASILKGIPDRNFLVAGHTAPFGTRAGRQQLSEERAKAIVDAMVQRGIPAGRFLFEGRGSTEQIAPNDTPENRRKNRRVEIIILED